MNKGFPVTADLLPARIKASRLRAGLSQIELATRLGISAVVLGHYERGIASPPRKGGGCTKALKEFLRQYPPPGGE